MCAIYLDFRLDMLNFRFIYTIPKLRDWYLDVELKFHNASVADMTCNCRWNGEEGELSLVGSLEKASHNPKFQVRFSSHKIVRIF